VQPKEVVLRGAVLTWPLDSILATFLALSQEQETDSYYLLGRDYAAMRRAGQDLFEIRSTYLSHKNKYNK
jgi:hypothetical protein